MNASLFCACDLLPLGEHQRKSTRIIQGLCSFQIYWKGIRVRCPIFTCHSADNDIHLLCHLSTQFADLDASLDLAC